MAIPSFIFGGDATAKSPQELAQQRAIIHALMSSQKAPRNVGEGLNALGDGIVASVLGHRADAADKAGQESAAEAFNPIVGALAGFPAAPTGASDKVASSGDPSGYRDAIASIESAGSGDYGAIGPTNKKLGRALGRYQIMEANIGPWSKEALGRAVTPQEFLADPKIQDAIFDHKFGSYVQKYGNPQDAASAWFTGQPLSVGANRRDVLGTSGNEYVDKFTRALGNRPAVAAVNNLAEGQPAQVASLDPSVGMAQTRQVPLSPGQNVSSSPEAQRVIEALTSPQSMTGGAPMGLQVGKPSGEGSPGEIRRGSDGQTYQYAETSGMLGANGPNGWIRVNTDASPAINVNASQLDLSRIPVTAGGNAGALPPGAAQSGPSLAQLLSAGGNQWLNENQSGIVKALLGQKLKEMDPNAGLEAEYKRAQIDHLKNPNARDKFGNSVIWGQDEEGNWVAMQPSSGGGMVAAKVPDGIKLSPPGMGQVNLGTSYGFRDRNGNIVGNAPIDNAGKAADAAEGKGLGEAKLTYDSMTAKLPLSRLCPI
jgi:hypothetical protein